MSIRICLCMTDKYIDTHFDVIKQHGSDAENRNDDSDCTPEWIRSENRSFINGFKNAGENIVLIDDDYNAVIEGLLNE